MYVYNKFNNNNNNKIIMFTKLDFNYLVQLIFNTSTLCEINYREILCFNISIILLYIYI
jgi:hypothetical protein